ncbi:MAG: hypothetical protein ACQGVK_22880 [Myxococcota bacterium]
MQLSRNRRRLAPWIQSLAVLTATLAFAPSSAALSLTPTTVVLIEGLEVDFLGAVDGLPAGGLVLAGAVAPADVTLLFRAEAATMPFSGAVDPNSIGLRGTGAEDVVGVGAIAGPGSDILAGEVGGVSGYGGLEIPALALGESTDTFFISYASLSDGDVLDWCSVDGLVCFGTPATVMPEPASALLLGLAVGGLACCSRSGRAGGRSARRSRELAG